VTTADALPAPVTVGRAWPDADWALCVFVPGRPAAQGSKKHVGGGRLVEQSKAVAPWRTTVAWHAAQTHRGAPLDGPLRVVVDFVMPRPAATPKRSTPPAIKRPDVDKLARAVLDALSEVIWRDDSQIVDLHVRKRLAQVDEQPGALIRIQRTA
jgi:crossover junction endodeoxyribonuclease RusA